MALKEFFTGYHFSQIIFDAIHRETVPFGGVSLHITKSMISLRRERNFAWIWIPGKYLTGMSAPLVLTISLHWRDGSPRWKEIVEPAPGRFTHHLELYKPAEIDQQVRDWLREAWEIAV
jgi:hypothetical protein